MKRGPLAHDRSATLQGHDVSTSNSAARFRAGRLRDRCDLRRRVGRRRAGRGDDRAPEPVHGGQPRRQHPQRHLDDRRLPVRRAARPRPRDADRRLCAVAMRLARVRQGRADRLDLPVVRSRAADPRLRSGDARDPRDLRAARRAEPARHDVLSELHRRRLLLPRRQGPHLECDQDEPSVGGRGARRGPLAGAGRRLRPLGRVGGQPADLLGAARLARAHLDRLQAGRPRRRARHRHPQDQDDHAPRADRELLRRRPCRPLHRVRQAHVPVQRRRRQPAGRRLEGDLLQLGHPQAGPSRTPGPEPRQPSSTTAATSRSPTTPTR